MKSIITKNGFNIMNQNRADGTVQYWIGYYGLAYIPEEDRELTEDTTELVEGNKGDVIYNLFQGGMTPVGFDTDNGKNSMAARIMNECMYTGSVINKFRYVLDKNDNNQLFVMEDYQPDGDALGLKEYAVFGGVGTTADDVDESKDASVSDLPIPAPLYYLGEPIAYTSDPDIQNMPMVSCDTRVYRASKDALTGDVNADPTIRSRADIYDWFDSEENVYTKTDSNSAEFLTLDAYWKYQSVSNFNRFHAPANVSGYAVDYEPACRNLSKATRLFPISHYDVIDTADDLTVSQVKYTISIDMDSVFSKVTKRTNAYYKKDGTKEDDPSKYKVGFKFNRIGVYAVPVTLHAYNTNEDYDGNCENHVVQMQISGNEEPQLFAILDLDSPIVLSEGNVTRYDVNFQIDFGEKGRVVNNSAIYYNLYEDDAITWYKNQLIANASTAEAVTSIGIQVNYLRKQLNDTVNNGSYLCGLGDSDNNVVVSTGSSLQNLVDGILPNGSVRGVDTMSEQSSLVVYKSNGRIVEKDAQNQYVYHDDPSESATKLVDLASYNLGTDSFALGKDSATASEFAFNMSKSGILNDDAGHNILFGGLPETSTDSLNDHIAISSTKYSIIGAADTTEIEDMKGSIWMSSTVGKKRYVDHSVSDSIGMGQVSAFQRDIDAPVGYQICGGQADEYDLLLGQMNLYAPVSKSIMLVNGYYGSPNDIGKVNLPRYLDINAILDGATTEDQIFGGAAYKTISASTIIGQNLKVDRDLESVISVGHNSELANGTKNSFVIGSNVNTNPAQRQPDTILTVDEFNAKYSGQQVADDDDTFRYNGDEPYRLGIVIGSGNISALNSDGSTYTHQVNGVCLYIRYQQENISDPDSRMIWATTSYDDIEPSDSLAMLQSYTPSGQHMKNMFMLGDDNSVGYNSCNSIILGDEAANRRISYKNSFINTAGSEKPASTESYGYKDFDKPMGIFNNVWWIGHNYSDSSQIVDPVYGAMKTSGDACSYADLGNFITNTWIYHSEDTEPIEFSDVFAFVGRNNRQYAYAPWYGANWLSSGWEDYSKADLYQPCKAPMIYTGGIALGGYGTSDSNFMLLKIGIRGCWSIDTAGVKDGTASMWTPTLGEVRNIVYLKDGQPSPKANKEINVNGKYDLYDNFCSDGIHHLQVDSPFAGRVLMVQDKQELDGTLHVGLGSISDAIYGTKRFISIQSRYVASDSTFTIGIKEGVNYRELDAFSTSRESYGPDFAYNTDYKTDVVEFGQGFKLSAIVNFEELPGDAYNCHIKKMYLEVPLDQRYMVQLSHTGSSTSVIIDNNNDCYIIGVGGQLKLPTYLWIEPTNIFHTVWHSVLALNGTSLIPSEQYETINIDNNRHVYKLMPVSWLYGPYEYSTRTFVDQNVFTSEIYYTASQSSLSTMFEEVTNSEGIVFTTTP